MLAANKSPHYSPKSGHICGGGGVAEFRLVLESKFIDCNTLGPSHRGKLRDNVCVYESVNICAWQ